MAISSQAPAIQGERQSDQDVRTQNVMACQAVANIVKSSLGPVALDKMLVDDVGDVTITNDGATILKMLEVEHPAANVLVELAELQDREINIWKDRRRRGRTSAKRGRGICCSGRVYRRSRRRRTCNRQSEDPPLLKAPRRQRETADEEGSNRKE
ncbi:hypothetical protein SLA2020_330070 [Shorea laevis]